MMNCGGRGQRAPRMVRGKGAHQPLPAVQTAHSVHFSYACEEEEPRGGGRRSADATARGKEASLTGRNESSESPTKRHR